MADTKPTRQNASKTSKPGEADFNASDANVLDPQPSEGQHDEGRDDLEAEASKVHGDKALDDLRDKRNAAAAAGDAAATAHLDQLIGEAERQQADRDERRGTNR